MVRRFAFTPRWIAWHVLMVVAVVSCVWLGDWQWVRSQVTGSMQNLAYALQWPLFAVFFAVMWWRMMRLESRRLDEEEAEAPPADPEEPPPAPTPAPAKPAAAPVVDDDEDPELAAYNRMLAQLAAQDAQDARR